MTAIIYTLSNKPVFKTKWQRLHIFSTAIIAILLICSCGSSSDKNINDRANDSTASAIVLPKPTPVSKAEADRLNTGCSLWFDSVLLLKGFNGGILVAKNGNITFKQ